MLTDVGRGHLIESGKLALNRALRDFIRRSVEAVGLPRTWRYLEELPVNAQGKATQAELMKLLDAAAPRCSKAAPSSH